MLNDNQLKKCTNSNTILVPKKILIREKSNRKIYLSFNSIHHKLAMKHSIIETEFQFKRLN